MKKKIYLSVILLVVFALSTIFAFGSSRFDEFASDRDTFYHNAIFDNSLIINGIDISAWQNVISVSTFKKMKAQGIDFVILRCGYTGSQSYRSHMDDCFEKNYTNAFKAGMEIGIYYYSLAGRVDDQTPNDLSSKRSKAREEASQEASFVLNAIEGKQISYPVYIDIEDPKYQSKSGKSVLAAAANQFCQDIEAAGYEAGVYASLSWLNKKIGSIDEQYHIWVAQYYQMCQYEKPYSMWQYTSSGRVNGFDKRLDVNFKYISSQLPEGDNSLANAQISLSKNQYTYSTLQCKPEVSVQLNDTVLTPSQDYSVAYYKNVKAGTAYAVITGKGEYVGRQIIDYAIDPYPLTSYEILPIDDAIYQNSKITPNVTVRKINGTKTLIKGVDYQVKYRNNTNVGTATVTITGIGNYTGKLVTSFEIKKATPILSCPEAIVFDQSNQFQLNASATVGAKVKYKSTDENIATVSNNGLVVAQGIGKATITIYCPSTTNTKYCARSLPVAIDGAINKAKVNNGKLTQATITWEKVAVAKKYNIYKLNEKTGKYVRFKRTDENKVTVEGLMPNTTYTYSIRAIDHTGHLGKRSEPIKVTPRLKALKELKTASITSNSATLTWKAQSYVSGYRVYKYDSSTKKYAFTAKIVGKNNTTFALNKLTSAKEYKFKVCSYYKTVKGPKTIVSFTTKPLRPKITKLSAKGTGLVVQWKKVRANGYKLYYSSDSKFSDKKVVSLSNKQTSYTIKPTKKVSTYYVKVRAFTKYEGKKNIWQIQPDKKYKTERGAK